MMKKFTILFASMALGCGAAAAEEMSVGYCDGGLVETAVSGASSVAIRLPGKDFPMYAGTRIIGARIGLMNDALKGIDFFLRSDLAGDDLLRCHTGVLYKGWSDIYFDSPIEWPAGDLCAGYDLTQNLAAGLSHVGNLGIVPESLWALNQGQWIDLTTDGGIPLCIQLLVEGDTYSKNDVAILAADNVVAEMGKGFEITGLLRNNTPEVLTSARLSCDWGEGVKEADAEVDDILPGEIGFFRAAMPAMGLSGDLTGNIGVVSVAGKADDYAFNNNIEVAITGVSNIVPRKVLIEEYTGQRCMNCPSGKERIEGGMKGLDNVVLICHHIGFYEDSMTAPGSEAMIYFFGKNDGSSYAPAIMYDRTPSPGNPGPVCTVSESSEIKERIVERQKLGAQVAIGLDANYDASARKLGIDVKLQQVEGMPIGNNPVLTIVLIENGIIASQEPAIKEYEHNEAVRKFVTAPLGDKVSLSADKETSCSYTVEIPKGCNEKNMEIVAFVSNYNSSNPNDCEVYNTEITAVPDGSGIEGLFQADAVPAEVYDLTGRRLSSMQPGINIVRYSDGSTRKVYVTNR